MPLIQELTFTRPCRREIAMWLSNMASDVNRWDHNVIGLGDFNLDHIHDRSTRPSPSLRPGCGGDGAPLDPATLFGSNLDEHYDQIAP